MTHGIRMSHVRGVSIKSQNGARGRAVLTYGRACEARDPEPFKAVRKVKLINDAMPFIRAIQQHGHIQHYGMGASRFWDKTAFLMSRVRDQAKQVVKKTWQKLFDSRRDQRPDIER